MVSSARGLLRARAVATGVPALAALLGVVVLGCASSRDFLGSLLPGGSRPSIYYVESEALPVYREPGREVLMRLARNEKVLRSRVEKGWAFVRVESTGLEGWVDNSRLGWRVPAAAESEPSDVTGTNVDATAAPPVPPKPAAQGEEEPKPAEGGTVAPSVFDPY